MKKFQIVVDSSCDLTNDYINDENVILNIVPLTIHVGETEFVDEEGLDIPNMLNCMREYKSKSTSSCPPVGKFEEEFNKAENTICITMTSKLSGTFNSARLAADMTNTNVHVVDSEATSGVLVLLVDKCYELMKQDLPFDEISKQIDEYAKTLNLLFVLDNFDNLIKNGRMSKAASVIAGVLKIKPIAAAVDGEIKLIEKKRTTKAALIRLVDMIGERVTNLSERTIVIAHCFDRISAESIKELILEKYKVFAVKIQDMKGLCSFYALEKAIMVSF